MLSDLTFSGPVETRTWATRSLAGLRLECSHLLEEQARSHLDGEAIPKP